MSSLNIATMELSAHMPSLRLRDRTSRGIEVFIAMIQRWFFIKKTTPETSLCSQSITSSDHASDAATNAADTLDAATLLREYPQLEGKTYLDHGGATLYASSMMERWTKDLRFNLYGNPHSESSPSIKSSLLVERVRQRALRFFGANPDDFDLIFVANCTAAIALLTESFRDYASVHGQRFWYAYHNDAHTSLIGPRTVCDDHRCFKTDDDVAAWIGDGDPDWQGSPPSARLGLFAYPGQSNFNGRRLPLQWPEMIRKSAPTANVFTLLDAASLAGTAPLNLSDKATAPDFVALSFYKIFGYPEIGALIVRKASGWPLTGRRYFGGGTVEMIVNADGIGAWHAKKTTCLHEQLEGGTVPFRSIVAINHAIDCHENLYGPQSMEAIASRTTRLSKLLYDRLIELRYENGAPVAIVYKSTRSQYGQSATQGAVMALNIYRPDGTFFGCGDVERAANRQNIYVRSGSLCNPGGISTYLKWSPADMRAAYERGHRCSDPKQLLHGKPTGVIRVTLGAMTTDVDILNFIEFVRGAHASPFLAETGRSW